MHIQKDCLDLSGWLVCESRALPRLCFWFLEDLTFLFAICLPLGTYFPSLRNNTRKQQLPGLSLGGVPSCYELDIMLKHRHALHSDILAGAVLPGSEI